MKKTIYIIDENENYPRNRKPIKDRDLPKILSGNVSIALTGFSPKEHCEFVNHFLKLIREPK